MRKKETDLFAPLSPSSKSDRVYKVSEITQDIKLILENTFEGVWVEGELSNVRVSSSAHQYFSLKDEKAVLQAVIFSRIGASTKFKLEDGLKVLCFGNIEVYPPHGKYQLIIERIEPKGIGALQLALEQLKNRLEKEGLFSVEHKRPIPYLPQRVGVVTSLQGAAIKDILKVLDRRFRGVHIAIRPVQVQGDNAKNQIAEAIDDFNLLNEGLPIDKRIEVLIVGRGGGSIEDLWAFNEEIVARSIYKSKIPVISAVGHERDITLSDLVADVRASTPSAAAEMVIPRKEDLEIDLQNGISDLKRSFAEICTSFSERLGNFTHRLMLNSAHIVDLNISNLGALTKKLILLNPANEINQHLLKIDDSARRLRSCVTHFLEIRQAGLKNAASRLCALSPLNILSRGYSITFSESDGVIKDAESVEVEDVIKTKLHNGEIISRVINRVL